MSQKTAIVVAGVLCRPHTWPTTDNCGGQVYSCHSVPRHRYDNKKEDFVECCSRHGFFPGWSLSSMLSFWLAAPDRRTRFRTRVGVLSAATHCYTRAKKISRSRQSELRNYELCALPLVQNPDVNGGNIQCPVEDPAIPLDAFVVDACQTSQRLPCEHYTWYSGWTLDFDKLLGRFILAFHCFQKMNVCVNCWYVYSAIVIPSYNAKGSVGIDLAVIWATSCLVQISLWHQANPEVCSHEVYQVSKLPVLLVSVVAQDS